MTDDYLRMIVTCCVMILLSFPIRFIKNRNQRYLYSFLVGSAIQAFVYRWQVIIIHIQNAMVYSIIKLKGRKCGALITVQSMLFLSFYHVYQMTVDYGGYNLNVAIILMIMVCKYSLFAYAYEDGGLPSQKLSKQAKYDAIQKLPSYFDFLGYLNFLPSSLLGPAIDYSNYKNFMEQRQPFSIIPSPWKQVGITFAKSIACGIVYVVGDLFFPVDYMKSLQFSQQGAIYIILYGWLAITVLRFKYYFAWKLSICSVQSSGIGYSVQHNKFNKINSVNVTQVQTNMHIREKIGYWNMSVQQWLRKAIYQRSPFKSKGASQLWVFMVSAFWHGYYPGYYFAFFFWFLQVYVQGLIFKFTKHEHSSLRKTFKKSGQIGRILITILVNVIFSSSAMFFVVLEGGISLNLMAKKYLIPQLLLIAGLVIFSLPIGKRKYSKAQIKQQQGQKLRKQ